MYRFELNELNEKDPKMDSQILISSRNKDSHATTALHILDLDKRYVLTSIFLNNIESHKYFEWLKQKFHQRIYGDSYSISDIGGFQHRYPNVMVESK